MKKETPISLKKCIRTLFQRVLLLLIITTISSCSETSDSTPDPTLTTMSPTTGPKTTVVTINGSNFGETNDLQVFFNDVEAIVQSSTATQISTIVPQGASTGLVKVISNGIELIGEEFTYILTTEVTTLAGRSVAGTQDGTGTEVGFNFPRGMVLDDEGNLYIAGGNNHRIRKITPDKLVSTLARNAPNETVPFELPYGIVLDSQENLFVTNPLNRTILKITTSTSEVSVFAGGSLGLSDGTGTEAEFSFPTGITIDSNDNLYIVDGSRIRKITPNATVTTIAGGGLGFEDGLIADAKFFNPDGIVIDSQNNLYITDTQNHRIRKITPDGIVSTIAGSTQGDEDGAGILAKFHNPRGITIDSEGNLYIADWSNHKIRKITPEGIVSTVAGSTNGFADGLPSISKFSHPNSIVVDEDGSLYISDQFNHRIRKITQD